MRKIIRGLVLMAAVLYMTGCQTQSTVETVEDEVVKIPIILTVNPSTGIRNDEELVNAFNREYEGVYQVEVEWTMETEGEYRNNLKRLNATDELPAVIMELRTLPAFYQLMIEDGRIEDLSSYLEADEEWKNMIEPAVLECCREADGSIYLAPISSEAFSCAGIFWNEELFAKAEIEKFPETWEEFWECCDKLQARGITPLALYTEGGGWAAMLPGGCWMIDQITEDTECQIRFAPFPGNKLVSSPEISGWAVVSSYDEEVKAGAIEFLKFRSIKNAESIESLFAQSQTEGSRLINDYVQAYGNEPQIVPDYQVKWNSVLQEKTLKEALPLFAQNKISPGSFIEMLNESVEEFKREQ